MSLGVIAMTMSDHASEVFGRDGSPLIQQPSLGYLFGVAYSLCDS